MSAAIAAPQVYGSVTPRPLPAAVGGSAESAAIGLGSGVTPPRAGGGLAWGAKR